MDFLRTPKGIIIHHSATRDTDTISYDAIAEYHVGENGWDEIGYQFVVEMVDGAPMLLTGRGLQYHGAHAAGFNDTIGICVVGNYDKTVPPPELISLLLRLVKGLVLMYPDIREDALVFHNSVSSKTCPGANFPPVADLRRWVFYGR